MDLLHLLLCASIFALLGVRIGWSARLGLLIPLALAAFAIAFVMTSQAFAAIGTAFLFNAFAQAGFGFGVLTGRSGKASTAPLAQRTDRSR